MPNQEVQDFDSPRFTVRRLPETATTPPPTRRFIERPPEQSPVSAREERSDTRRRIAKGAGHLLTRKSVVNLALFTVMSGVGGTALVTGLDKSPVGVIVNYPEDSVYQASPNPLQYIAATARNVFSVMELGYGLIDKGASMLEERE